MKKAHNWFQRQFSRNMSHDYDFMEMEHATAVAAAAFAISSHVSEIPHEQKMWELPETSLAKTRSKAYDKKSSFSHIGAASKRLSGSFKITDEQGNKVPTTSSIREEKRPEKTTSFAPASSMTKTPTFGEKSKRNDDKNPDILTPKRTPSFGGKDFINTDDIQPETPKPKIVPTTSSWPQPPPPPPPPQPPVRPSTRPGATEAKADTWEREELKKIKERYEKLLETIDSWEKRKKMKARRKLNKHEVRFSYSGPVWITTLIERLHTRVYRITAYV